tara:strand:+ start:273 stop:497 length:225 start_codon:yes stop_codon:yes gene_type:complete
MSYKSFSSGGSSASKKAKPSKELYQEDIDLITDPSVENKVCLSCDSYEVKGLLLVRANTTLTIPRGTTLIITDK